MKTCPACNKVLVNDDPECPHCGIIISKWLSRGVPKAESNAASVYSNKNNWMIWVVACFVFIFLIYWLNKKVKEKTVGMTPHDTVKMANRFALKTVGMDNPYQFIDFIRDGDIKAVNQYLSAGYSPNILVAGSLPIAESMHRNNMEMFNLLIKNGADVNMKDSRGLVPLSIALEWPVGNTPYFVRELVKAGANIEDPAIKENPKFKKIMEGNDVSEDNQFLNIVKSAITRYYAQNEVYPESLEALAPKYIPYIPKGNWKYDPKTGKVGAMEGNNVTVDNPSIGGGSTAVDIPGGGGGGPARANRRNWETVISAARKQFGKSPVI